MSDSRSSRYRLPRLRLICAWTPALITAARERAELFLRRALVTRTLEYSIDSFRADEIDLRRPPLQSVEWIKYVDAAGTLQTLSAENYLSDVSSNEIARIAFAWNCCRPMTRSSVNAVVIRFVAGYGNTAEDVPQAIRHGILIEIANLYKNREDVVTGQSVDMVRLSERLLWPYRALTAD